MKWIKISEEKPPLNIPVFISDGVCLAVASYYKSPTNLGTWLGEGFGGYEWEWDFDPTHWAKIDIELPPIEISFKVSKG